MDHSRVQRDHLLADRVDRGRIQLAGYRLNPALDRFHGGRIDFQLVTHARGRMLEGLRVAVNVLGFPHVPIQIVVVYESGNPVGRRRKTAVVF